MNTEVREVPPRKKTTFEQLFDAELYAQLLARAQAENVKVVHVRRMVDGYDEEYEKFGGATAAVGRSLNRGRYAKMAVAICSHNETFNKKLGSFVALKSYYEDKVIPIALGSRTPSSVAVSMLETVLDV